MYIQLCHESINIIFVLLALERYRRGRHKKEKNGH